MTQSKKFKDVMKSSARASGRERAVLARKAAHEKHKAGKASMFTHHEHMAAHHDYMAAYHSHSNHPSDEKQATHHEQQAAMHRAAHDEAQTSLKHDDWQSSSYCWPE